MKQPLEIISKNTCYACMYISLTNIDFNRRELISFNILYSHVLAKLFLWP